MASKEIEMGLVLVLVAMLWSGVVAQSSCQSTIISLAPCLNYITGNSSTPSSSCCSQLASTVQSQPQCLCSMLNGGGASFGITINKTLALALPGACNVKTPPISQCNAAGGPTTSATPPVSSPTSSPADETPQTAATPSASDSPSAAGSKTVPLTGGNSSNGSIVRSPIHCVLLLLFIASCASTVFGF